MPTVMSHGLFALALGHLFSHRELPWRFWALAVGCAMLPDLDVIGLYLGIPYGDVFGHRGFSHSLLFAGLLSGLVVLGAFGQARFGPLRARLWLFFFLVTASHGLFDAMTNGGLGIAFFAPFDNGRYFLPFRPISVSPIGLDSFLQRGGWRVLSSEILWIGLPSVMLLLFSVTFRVMLVKNKVRQTD